MEQIHIDIVLNGFKEVKSDDDILRELFESGLSFDKLRPTFNEIVKENGLRLSAKERKVKTNELLLDWEPVDSGDLLAKTSMLKDELKVTDSKALSAIRSWAKENNVELPKTARKPKELKVGFSGHIHKVLELVKQNRTASREDIQKMCESVNVPVNYTTMVMNIVAFANEWNDVEAATEEADSE